MSLTDYIYKKSALFKLILLISAFFAQNCSNDERLEDLGSQFYRNKVYETNKKAKNWLLEVQKILNLGHIVVVGQAIV